MLEFIMYRGIPASGKTTAALDLVKNSKEPIIRVNKDDLRAQLHGGVWSQSHEKMILKARDALIIAALSSGTSVVEDSTNLHTKHEARFRQLAQEYKARFVIQDFHCELQEAIRRDLLRAKPVGEDVIRRMWNEYIRPKLIITQDEKRPSAIICDLDGTLAFAETRSYYDTEGYINDKPNTMLIEILQSMRSKGYSIILVSGRKESTREETEKWLTLHNVEYEALYMRPMGDDREDSIVKRELFESFCHNVNVKAVFDDRLRVVDMWRDLGLFVYSCGEGRF